MTALDLEAVSKRLEELSDAHDELDSRQNETDVSVVKVLGVVTDTKAEVGDIKRWVLQLLKHNGLKPEPR